jgi:hypothetical protein
MHICITFNEPRPQVLYRILDAAGCIGVAPMADREVGTCWKETDLSAQFMFAHQSSSKQDKHKAFSVIVQHVMETYS